jgi:hypothetical protein
MSEWSLWSWLVPVIVVLFFVCGYYHDHHLAPRRQAKRMVEAEEYRTGEEYLFREQTKFERRIIQGDEIMLPDALRGREVFIYRNLMRVWFAKLAAQARYDEPKIKKLRKDWLVYMEVLRRSSTSAFLSRESGDEAQRERYGREAHEQKMRTVAIEDAFAEAIGPEAVERLREIREKKYDSFSASGELAPDGYRYWGFSVPGIPEQPVPRLKS